jgi:hypothetical protein
MIDYKEMEGRVTPPGIPDDIGWLGDEIGHLGKLLHLILNELRGQNAPLESIINVNPGTIWQSTQRMRATAIVFSGGTPGDVIGVKLSSAVAFDFIVPVSPGPFTLPMPMVIPSGQDVSVIDVTTPANTNYKARVLAYVELDREKL